jgi:hypothetical protein
MVISFQKGLLLRLIYHFRRRATSLSTAAYEHAPSTGSINRASSAANGCAPYRLKLQYGRIAQTRALKARLDRLPPDARAQHARRPGEIDAFSVAPIFDKCVVLAPLVVNFRVLSILCIALSWLRNLIRHSVGERSSARAAKKRHLPI